MKFKSLILFVLAAVLFFSPNLYAQPKAAKAPVIFVAQPTYKFDLALEGDEVRHDFVVQNKGNADLKITRVHTGWGCTAVSFPRLISPGREGIITIKVDTDYYGGERLKKVATIYSNDPGRGRLDLTVSGPVEKFVELSAKEIKLHGLRGKPIVGYVTIKPRKKYPFKIVEVKLPKDAKVKCKLTETNGPKGPGYKLEIKNITDKLGYYLETVTLKTDSAIRPEIFINISGRVYELAKKKKKKG